MKDEMTIKEARKIAYEAMRKLDECIDYIDYDVILEELDNLNINIPWDWSFYNNDEKLLEVLEEALEDAADEACSDVARIKRRNKNLSRK